MFLAAPSAFVDRSEYYQPEDRRTATLDLKDRKRNRAAPFATDDDMDVSMT